MRHSGISTLFSVFHQLDPLIFRFLHVHSTIIILVLVLCKLPFQLKHEAARLQVFLLQLERPQVAWSAEREGKNMFYC